MSNSVSSGINAATKSGTARPIVPPTPRRQTQFETGTQNLLDEARTMVENAVGQGQELNPMIYQMLGLQPTYEDHSADFQQAQSEFSAAQKQASEAQQTIAQLESLPRGKRSPQQRQQLRQLRRNMPNLNNALGKSQEAVGRLQSMPKTITGLSRMDPNQIPKESPYSPQNQLNQLAMAEQQRALQYTQAGSTVGGEGGAAAIDPTLVHQYTVAEQALRSSLASRYGADYANSTVGQMALANFARQKNEAFATWNQQMQEKYSNQAFGSQANLQNLLANQIGLMREPANWSVGAGGQLSNLAGQRLTEQQTFNQRLGMHVGLQENVSSAQPVAGQLAGLVGSALTTPSGGGSSPASSLYNWATGTPSAAEAARGYAEGEQLAAGAGAQAGAGGAAGASDIEASGGGGGFWAGLFG